MYSKRIAQLLTFLLHPDCQTDSVEMLAQKCHSNPTTLQQEFQAVFGISIVRYRREQWLQMARNYLKQQMSVSQAAQQAGYENPECFSKAFKKIFWT